MIEPNIQKWSKKCTDSEKLGKNFKQKKIFKIFSKTIWEWLFLEFFLFTMYITNPSTHPSPNQYFWKLQLMFLKLSESFSAGYYDTTRLSERASCGPLEHFYSHLQIVENFQFWEEYLEPFQRCMMEIFCDNTPLVYTRKSMRQRKITFGYIYWRIPCGKT